jgi:hypothetical protein
VTFDYLPTIFPCNLSVRESFENETYYRRKLAKSKAIRLLHLVIIAQIALINSLLESPKNFAALTLGAFLPFDADQ